MANELAVMNPIQMQTYDGGRLPAIQQLGTMLAKSGYFSDAREAAQAGVKVMAGEELGIGPVASMMGINIIKGKIALSANLMASQVRRHGYNYRVTRLENDGCVLQFIGKRGESLGESSYTRQDAETAKLAGNDNYKTNPRNMFFARAMSNGVKWYCPEVTSGLPVYTPDELGARVNGDGEMIHEDPDPRGSQAAADAVAERKIAEMKAQQRPTEQKQPANAGKSKDFAMLKAFKEIKPKIGTDAYYRVLGVNGFEHANDITDPAKGRAIYKEMMDVLREQQRKAAEQPSDPEPRQPADTLNNAGTQVADESDLPDEMWPEGRE